MRRHPALSVAEIQSRLRVDLDTGKCYWIDATKHHARLNGLEAGGPRNTKRGAAYWVIKINGIGYKRAQIVLTVKTGRWPDAMVDHQNGDTLDDRAENLRHATAEFNCLNLHTRRKGTDLPIGVRQLPSGIFQARIRQQTLGTFATASQAGAVCAQRRKELLNANA